MTITQSDATQPQFQVCVGDVLAGKYRVERVIGVGGMGVVVAATHLELDTQVAIKLLLPEFRTNTEVVARFSREARAAVQIKSDYVARTLDVGRLENGCPYIVMEYLEGTDLAQRIAEGGPLPYAEAVRFALHACDALIEAHALGIVHRDLKPSNLFLSRRRDGTEVGKILDFGISKLTQASVAGPQMDMTRTTSLMGSPLYMSPEQLVAAKSVDLRADIWAMGVTLYEALAGAPPFTGETLPELCTRIMTQPAKPLSMYRRDLPVQLTDAVMRCLEKDPSQRFGSIGEFANAIRPFAPISHTASLDRGSNAFIAVSAHEAHSSMEDKRAVAAVTGVPTLNAWGQTSATAKRRPIGITKRAVFWAVSLVAVVSTGIGFLVIRSQSRATLRHDTNNSAARSIGTVVKATSVDGEREPSREAAPSVTPVRGGALTKTNTTPEASSTPTSSVSVAATSATSLPALAPPTTNRRPSRSTSIIPGAAPPAKVSEPNKRSAKDLFGDRN